MHIRRLYVGRSRDVKENLQGKAWSPRSGQEVCNSRRVGPVYFFTDETGNQTGGKYFIVAGLAIDAELGASRQALKEIEQEKNGIGKLDWHKANQPRVRCRFLCSAMAVPTLQTRMFCVRYEGRRDYWQCTIEALQIAMRRYAGDRLSIVSHEGFTVSKRDQLQRRLIGDFEVRSGNFDGEPLIRFADRMAGGLAINAYWDVSSASRYACPFDRVTDLTP